MLVMNYKNTNSAVIKQWFCTLKKTDLINEAQKLKLLIIATPVDDCDLNYRNKLLDILRFARVAYIHRFLQRR